MDRHVIGSPVEVGLVTTPEAYLALREYLKPSALLEVGAWMLLACAAISLALSLLIMGDV